MNRKPKYVSPEQQAHAAALRTAPPLLLRGVALVLGCEVACLLLAQWLGLGLGWGSTVLSFAFLTAIALPGFYLATVRTVSKVVARESAVAADRRFRAIFAEIQDGILVTDGNANILLSNPAAERIYSVPQGSLTGKNIESLIPADCVEAFQEDLKAAREGGKGSITGQGVKEVDGMRASGDRFPMEISVSPVEEPEGLRFVRIVRDISERKRTEREIARLANFPRANPNFVFECQPDGTVTYANPAAERLRVSPAGTVINLESLIPGFPRMARDCLKQGIARFGLETEWNERYLLWILQPAPETSRVLAYATDITERKLAEQARVESERQMRDLLDTLPVAVRVVMQGKTLFANAAAAQMLGFARVGDMIATDPLTLISDKDRERLQEYRRRREAGQDAPGRYEATMLRKDRTEMPVEVIAARFLYEGRPASLLVFRDLSERKKLQLYEKILPVCCMCGNIRDDAHGERGQGAWGRLDHYVMRHSDMQLSHTFCPLCLEKYRQEQGLSAG